MLRATESAMDIRSPRKGRKSHVTITHYIEGTRGDDPVSMIVLHPSRNFCTYKGSKRGRKSEAGHRMQHSVGAEGP